VLIFSVYCAFDLNGTEAKSRFPCPSGQIFRVSKKICVPKGADPKLFTEGPIVEGARAPRQGAGVDFRAAAEPGPGPERIEPAAIHEEAVVRQETLVQETLAQETLTKVDPRSDAMQKPGAATAVPAAAHETALAKIFQLRSARESDTEQLEELVVFCRLAMKTYPRAEMPLAWAALRNNLANALAILEERNGGSEFEEPVALYREALKERTKQNAPRDWATIQTNLAQVLTILGLRENAVPKLAEAAAVKREAIDWAKRTGDEGVALMRRAERLSDKEIAQQALAQIDTAVATIQDGDHVPLLAAYYVEQLPRARALVEQLSAAR
jgi:tetratricopeptide (TPR) repeat protein